MTEPVPFVYARFAWQGHPFNMPQPRIQGSRMFDISYGPTADYPLGRRGLVMLRTWETLRAADTLGMIVQDGDVLVDPHDYLCMLEGIHAEPKAVVTAPVRLWRANAGGLPWHWAHWRGKASQDFEADPDFFCFNFTYLPRDLLDACVKANMRAWTFPTVDTQVSRVARRLGIPVRVCAALPKHMNF